MQIDHRKLMYKTGEIVACLTKCRNTHDLVQELHRIIADIVNVENFCIVLLREDGTLHFPFISGKVDLDSTVNMADKTIEDIQSTLTFYALTSNMVCNYSKEMIDNLQRESLVELHSDTPQQWISIPLSVDDESLGAIIVQTFDTQTTYSDEDVELLVIISHVLSNALSAFNYQEQLYYANSSLKAYQTKLEELIEARTASLEQKTKSLELEVTQRKLLQKELEQKLLLLENEMMVNQELRVELAHQASHDFLTGLSNRQDLHAYLARCRSKMARSELLIHVLFIDLDGFKQVNDNYSHEVGDSVLVSVGARLEELMRKHDFIARIGGDEFVVVLESIKERELVDIIAQRIIDKISEPYLVDDNVVTIGASIGVAQAQTPEALDQVVLDADHAMYNAKSCGKGVVSWHKVN